MTGARIFLFLLLSCSILFAFCKILLKLGFVYLCNQVTKYVKFVVCQSPRPKPEPINYPNPNPNTYLRAKLGPERADVI